MVIPVLPCHLYRDKEEHQRGHASHRRRDGERSFVIGGLLRWNLREIAAHGRSDRSDTEAHPDSEGVERSHISIITLTRLSGILIEVQDDGNTRHKEEHKRHPEALYPTATTPDLEEEPDETKDQRQRIVDVVPLIIGHIHGVRIAIPVEETIDEGDTRSSPTTQKASIPLQVILTPGEVPHKVAPVHIRQLIVEEVRQVIPEGRLRHILRITPHPGIVHLGVTTIVDAREEHHPFALVDGFILGSTGHIAVGVRRIILLHTPIGRLSVLELRAAIGTIFIG